MLMRAAMIYRRQWDYMWHARKVPPDTARRKSQTVRDIRTETIEIADAKSNAKEV
jgi:hypothetical protein